MSVDGTSIAAPISVSDPYVLMGVAKFKGTYDVGYICGNLHRKINMFAKYKPIYHPNPGASHEIDPLMWKGTNGNCGIRFVMIDSIFKVPNNSWGYMELTTGQHRRLSDFDGYDHEATPWITVGDNDINISIQDIPNGFNITAGGNIATSSSSLKNTDFAGSIFDKFYLTSCIFVNGRFVVKSAVWEITATHQQGFTIYWDWNDLQMYPVREGKFPIYMVLSSRRYNSATWVTDIKDNNIIPVWHNAIYRNPFYLNIEDKPLFEIYISRLGRLNYDGSSPIEYFEIDWTKIGSNSDGTPSYSALNVLKSDGTCFFELTLINNNVSYYDVNLQEIGITATNFKMKESAMSPIRICTDRELKNNPDDIRIEAGKTVYLYAFATRLFNLDRTGSIFTPNQGACIAPCQLVLFKQSGDIWFPVTEFVVRTYT